MRPPAGRRRRSRGGQQTGPGRPRVRPVPTAADPVRARRRGRRPGADGRRAARRPRGRRRHRPPGRLQPGRRPAHRLAAEQAIGKYVFDVLPFRDEDGRDWWVCVDPYNGLSTRTRHPERSLYLTDGTELLVSVGYVRDGRSGPVRRLVITPARRAAAGPARAQPGRARLHRRARAPLPADLGQGVHRDAAGQVGPVHRRPEAGHARDGQRRRRPGDQADHRAARRVEDRVRPDGGPPPAGRRARPGQEDHRRPGGGGRARGQVPPRRPRPTCRRPGWTPTRSTRSSAIWWRTRSGTGLVS